MSIVSTALEFRGRADGKAAETAGRTTAHERAKISSTHAKRGHTPICLSFYGCASIGDNIHILFKYICVVSRVQSEVLVHGDHFGPQQLKHPLPPDKGRPSGHTASSGRHTAKQTSCGSGRGTGGTMQHRAQSPPSVGGTRICPSLQTWSLGKHAFRQAIGGGSGSASVADAATSTTAARIVLENIVVVLAVVWDVSASSSA